MNSAKQPVGSMTVEHYVGPNMRTLQASSFRFLPKGSTFMLWVYFGKNGERAPMMELQCSSGLTTGTHIIDPSSSSSTVMATWGEGTHAGANFNGRGTGIIKLDKFTALPSAHLIAGSFVFDFEQYGEPQKQKVDVKTFSVSQV